MALCELGGAGKTSAALAYAHRHLAKVGLAWQFPADDPSVAAAEFGELARGEHRQDGQDAQISRNALTILTMVSRRLPVAEHRQEAW